MLFYTDLILILYRYFVDSIRFVHPWQKGYKNIRQYSKEPLFKSSNSKCQTRMKAVFNKKKLETMISYQHSKHCKNRVKIGTGSSNIVEQCNADNVINSRKKFIRSFSGAALAPRQILWCLRLNETR